MYCEYSMLVLQMGIVVVAKDGRGGVCPSHFPRCVFQSSITDYYNPTSLIDGHLVFHV